MKAHFEEVSVFCTYRKATGMDNLCELKFNIVSVMHRLIDRALYLEQAIDALLGVLSQAVPHSTAAVILSDSDEVRFFFTPSRDDSDAETKHRIRSLYKTGFDLVFRIPQPFVVLRGNPRPVFLDRKALQSIQKEQVRFLGSPVILFDEIVGAIMVERLFTDRVALVEDVQFLSMLSSFIAQVLSLES